MTEGCEVFRSGSRSEGSVSFYGCEGRGQ